MDVTVECSIIYGAYGLQSRLQNIMMAYTLVLLCCPERVSAIREQFPVMSYRESTLSSGDGTVAKVQAGDQHHPIKRASGHGYSPPNVVEAGRASIFRLVAFTHCANSTRTFSYYMCFFFEQGWAWKGEAGKGQEEERHTYNCSSQNKRGIECSRSRGYVSMTTVD